MSWTDFAPALIPAHRSLIIICAESIELEEEGEGLPRSRMLLSDPMGWCEVYNLPASPPHPHLTSIWRGTSPTTGFVWGVGVRIERSHSHSLPTDVENNRYSGIIGWNVVYSVGSWKKMLNLKLHLLFKKAPVWELSSIYSNISVQRINLTVK